MSEVLNRNDALARVEVAAPQGMVALKGDLADTALAAAVHDMLGAALPEVRHFTVGPGGRAFWMAPDELLLMVPDAAATIATLQDRLAGAFVTLADVSDMRAMFTIRGTHSRDALAKLAPVDFSDLSTGQLRRTRLAQIAGMIWCESDTDWGVVCFRSVADYAAGLLNTAVRAGGQVGLYR